MKNTESFVVAVDGEAASGKGTLCKKLAERFDLFYCQTSIFYRKLARLAIDDSINKLEDLLDVAKSVERLEKVDTASIYAEEVGTKASEIASIPKVREALNIPQKDLLKIHSRIIMEGRDIGTVIAPKADVKLYITANIDVRAERRFKERVSKEEGLTLEKVKEDLIERDRRDKERKDAPLAIAKDAIILDSSNLNAEEFLNLAINEINKKVGKWK